MKLIHLSDLHLGKRVHEFPMLEDQKHIIKQILGIIDREEPDAVLIAGDVYDRTIPQTEAVNLLDGFLTELTARNLPVLLISGNHDSADRLAFGGRVMERSRIHISPVYDGKVKPVTIEDEYGPVDFFLLPFLKPAVVRACFPGEEVESTNDAVSCAVRHLPRDPSRRRVLVAHQFVTGASTCDSEEMYVGGSDNVDADVFGDFDYVALGHLHGPQNPRPNIRYCGSPLKYSFSELHQKKGVTIVRLGEKGSLSVEAVPLTPLREMRELRGAYEQLTALDFYRGLDLDDYYRIILTDENDKPEAMGCLRSIYPNLMCLEYDNARTRNGGKAVEALAEIERKSPLEVFAALYEQQNAAPLSGEQEGYLRQLIEEIWEVEA